MTNRTIAEFDLGSYDTITEFYITTEGDDLFFKLNASIDYFLGDNNYNATARHILLENNKLDQYHISHDTDTSKLRIKVIIEEVEE